MFAGLSESAQHDDRQIAHWLIFVAVLIFIMVVLGGVTRLTGSGLSMVEWDPLMGAIPPLSEQHWQETFEKYKQYPEYRHRNYGMSLSEFKSIFAFEYAHRMLGRFIGIAFLVPFLWFLFRKKIRRDLLPKLVFMFVLGGLQGLMGWFMVKSGLIDDPHVSQYRLTAHLSLAFLIYSYILWTAWSILSPAPTNLAVSKVQPLRTFALLVTAVVVLQILSGAFVAGTRAGFTFNTFPLMNGDFIPPGLFILDPWYRNFFDNVVTVQFDHRIIAYILTILVVVFWWRSKSVPVMPRTQRAMDFLLIMLIVQVALGITTLVYIVPVALGAAHQGGALLLLTIALFINHELRAGKYF